MMSNNIEQAGAFAGVASMFMVTQATLLAITSDDPERRRAAREQLLADLRAGHASAVDGLRTTQADLDEMLADARERDAAGLGTGNAARAEQAAASVAAALDTVRQASDIVDDLAGDELRS